MCGLFGSDKPFVTVSKKVGKLDGKQEKFIPIHRSKYVSDFDKELKVPVLNLQELLP